MIRIITDSTSDLSAEKAQDLNVTVVPLSVSFGEDTYKSGIDISNQEFYRRLIIEKKLPKTAQVNPFEFEKVFKEALDAGDEVISIHISSDLSGTYQSACIAKDSLDSDKIHVIDSRTVTGCLGLLVELAARKRDEGLSAEEIVKVVEEYIPKTRLYVVLDTLDYLKLGGRISSTAAFIGSVLNMHPIVTVNNGLVEVFDKAKGKKCAIRQLRKIIQDKPKMDGSIMYVGNADADERGLDLKAALETDGVTDITDNLCLGSIVGTYTGPDAIGIFYFEK